MLTRALTGIAVAICLTVFPSIRTSAQDDVDSLKRSRVIVRSNDNGTYHVYIPSRQPERILVVVHGTPNKKQSTVALADTFIQRWTSYAKKKDLILISPAFDQDNFGSDPDTGFGYGGYRGLFGKQVGADEHVINLVSEFMPLCKIQDQRFLLYGHSAGGQFTIRFCVRHPDRIAAAVACAPGRFTFPANKVGWPYGMGKFSRTIKWSPTESSDVTVEPDPAKFAQAALLPLTVLYGEQDLAGQPKRAAHEGETRIDYGTGWVDSMNELVPEGVKPTVSLELVPKIGHDSAKLTPICQKEFNRLKWIEPSPFETYRIWQDKTGKFKINAIFQSQDSLNVVLKTSKAELLTVEKSKLCDEDLELLISQNERD